MQLRIATWNMRSGGRPEAWRHLEEQLRPDIALLQEARPRNRAYPGFKRLTPVVEGARWWPFAAV